MNRGWRASWNTAIWTLATGGLLACLSCGAGGNEASPPLSIGPYQQARFLQGAEAQNMVRAMHPQPIAPKQSWVGYYGGGKGITVYASRFNDPAETQSALGQMRDALAGDKSGFQPPQASTMEKQPGFKTHGLERDHFFFARGPWLIWIEGKTADILPALKAVRWSRSAPK